MIILIHNEEMNIRKKLSYLQFLYMLIKIISKDYDLAVKQVKSKYVLKDI